jgi:hypothetical protein
MEKITKGDKIFNFLTNSEHIVEELEIIKNQEIIYTEDKKSFSSNSVIKITHSLLGMTLIKFIEKKPLSEYENRFISDSISQYLISVLELKNFERKLKEFKNLSKV